MPSRASSVTTNCASTSFAASWHETHRIGFCGPSAFDSSRCQTTHRAAGARDGEAGGGAARTVRSVALPARTPRAADLKEGDRLRRHGNGDGPTAAELDGLAVGERSRRTV